MVWDARRETASTGENPASANLAKIVVTSSVGSGTVRSGAAATGGGRPEKYKRLGAPAQLVIPTAAARWTLGSKALENSRAYDCGRCLQVTSTQTGFEEDRELAISNVVDSEVWVRACQKHRESDLPSVSVCKFFHKDRSRIRKNKKAYGTRSRSC
jgi:hypothetical protein